jgi:hypothetical protein
MRHTILLSSMVCLLSQVGCTPKEDGDADASTSTSGDSTGDVPTTGVEASTGSTGAANSSSDATTGDATTGDATTGDATTGDATTGDATTGDALDCSAPGTLRIVAPALGIDIHDEDAAMDVFEMEAGGVFGVADGMQYYFWRDGDIGDGTLDAGVHDVSEYPHHMVLLVGPADVDCEFDAQCQVLYGLGGTWDIASGQPLVGTLQATDLTSEEGCWEDGPPIDTLGCRLADGTLQACFNVAW